MSKKNISATVDPEIAEFVGRSDVNTSGLVNRLLKQHMSGETGREQMLQLRIDQVEGEIESLESRIETKREKLQRLESQLDEMKEETDDVLDQAAEALEYSDFENRTQPVDYWMDEAGLSFNELQSEVEDRWSTY